MSLDSRVVVDEPMWAIAGAVLDVEAGVELNSRLGPYRIDALLGAGGMDI